MRKSTLIICGILSFIILSLFNNILLSQDIIPENYRISPQYQTNYYHLTENSVAAFSMDSYNCLLVGLNGTNTSTGQRRVCFFNSTDGGHTWNPQSNEQSILDDNSLADPSVVNSWFYHINYILPLQFIAYITNSMELKIARQVYSTNDWDYFFIDQNAGQQDKPHLWKNNFNDHLFCVINGPVIYEGYYNFYSTWEKIYSPSSDNSEKRSSNQKVGANIKTDCNNNIYIIYTEQQSPWNVFFVKGEYFNGNYNWSNEISIDQIGVQPNPGINNGVGFPVLSIEPYTFHLFAVYPKYNSVNSTIDIYMKKSTDGGINWDNFPIIVNQNQTGKQWMPWVAYNHGILACIYYDGRTSGSYSTYVSYSLNEGNNWIDQRVSSSNFNLNPVSGLTIGNDYLGITIDDFNNIIYPVWSDDRIFIGDLLYKAWCAPFSITNNSNMDINIKNILYQNNPNPFNPKTIIKYYIQNTSFVSIKIYDILGKEIQSLVNKIQNSGIHEISFDGSNLSSGIYYYSIISNNYKDTKKMLLIK